MKTLNKTLTHSAALAKTLGHALEIHTPDSVEEARVNRQIDGKDYYILVTWAPGGNKPAGKDIINVEKDIALYIHNIPLPNIAQAMYLKNITHT